LNGVSHLRKAPYLELVVVLDQEGERWPCPGDPIDAATAFALLRPVLGAAPRRVSRAAAVDDPAGVAAQQLVTAPSSNARMVTAEPPEVHRPP